MTEVQEHSKIRFFEPYIGDMYGKDENMKKILVLGASFYCDKNKCKYYADCTSPEKKNSKEYDTKCPFADDDLSKEPSTAIKEKYGAKTYQNFEIFLQAVFLKENPWEYVAFTNYVQFMLPSWRTDAWLISDRDFDAFEEVVERLEPDVIITWGNEIKDHINSKIKVTHPHIDNELIKNEHYLFHAKIGERDVTIVNLYHPSALSYWCKDLRNSSKYVKMALDEKNKIIKN